MGIGRFVRVCTIGSLVVGAAAIACGGQLASDDDNARASDAIGDAAATSNGNASAARDAGVPRNADASPSPADAGTTPHEAGPACASGPCANGGCWVIAASADDGGADESGVDDAGTQDAGAACVCPANFFGEHCEIARIEWIPYSTTNELTPTAISADGRVVVGYKWHHVVPPYPNGWRWTSATGLVDLAGTNDVSGTNVDGTVLVGNADDTHRNEYSMMWTPTGGMTSIGIANTVDSSTAWNSAMSVSSDGTVVGGLLNCVSGCTTAYRWTAASGVETIPGWAGGSGILPFAGMSADGLTIIGNIKGANGSTAAARWTEATGIETLAMINQASNTISEALAVNADATVIVGIRNELSSGKPWQPFKWSAATQVGEALPNPAGANQSEPIGVSGDGATVVGVSFAGNGRDGTIWDAAGARLLADVLASAGVGLPGSHLGDAIGASADGKVIIGTGSSGLTNAIYVVRLP